MPELPEVETTLRGITPHILKQTVTQVVIRRPNLRWPIPAELPQLLTNQQLLDLFNGQPVALVTISPGERRLVLLNDGEQQE